jgi:hypothetical protein
MPGSGEYIYYTVTSSQTVKFGASSNAEGRQRSHYTSSPFLAMHKFKVNDAFRAESELHRLAEPYKLKEGDNIGGSIIGGGAQLREHYRLTKVEAEELCRAVQKDFHENLPIGEGRSYCVNCLHVVNTATLMKNDGFRCKRCFDRISSEIFKIKY